MKKYLDRLHLIFNFLLLSLYDVNLIALSTPASKWSNHHIQWNEKEKKKENKHKEKSKEKKKRETVKSITQKPTSRIGIRITILKK